MKRCMVVACSIGVVVGLMACGNGGSPAGSASGSGDSGGGQGGRNGAAQSATSSSASSASSGGSSSATSSSASSGSSSATSSSASSGSSSGSSSASSSASSGAGGGGGTGFMPGPHADPELIPMQGGPVLSSVQLVTITFSNDPHVDLEEAFGDWVVNSSWLAAAQADYGVGTGVHLSKVRIPQPAPAAASTAAIEAFIVQKIMDGTLPAPSGSMSNLLFAVYYPATTTLVINGGSVHCQGFSGYHTEGTALGARFAFAAIGDCPTYLKSLTEVQNIMRTASHEIIEATTDPFVATTPAYSEEDSSDPWYYFAGEVADICPLSQYITEGQFLAQRYWSNSAAKAGVEPCIPAPAGEVYFNTSVAPTKTQIVSAGGSVTFALQGWSTGETSPWKLQASSVLSDFKPGISLSTTTMSNGGTGTLTLTVPAGTPIGSTALVELFSYQIPTNYHPWPVALEVGNVAVGF